MREGQKSKDYRQVAPSAGSLLLRAILANGKPSGDRRMVCILALLVAFTAQGMLTTASYIRSCRYHGDLCLSGKTSNISESGFIDNRTNIQEDKPKKRNVSCSDNIEYCTRSVPTDEWRHQCFSLYEVEPDGIERKEVLAGCIYGHDLQLCMPHACNFSHRTIHSQTQKIFDYCCCHTSDQCNDGIIGYPEPPSASITHGPSEGTTVVVTDDTKKDSGFTQEEWLAIILLPVIALSCIVIFATGCYMVYRKRRLTSEDISLDRLSRTSSMLTLRQEQIRPITGKVDLGDIIGKGRYSRVHRGLLNGETNVAVKIFPESERSAWQNECEMYNTMQMTHRNILVFIGTSVRETPVGFTERWLVGEYHHKGSLTDFLRANTVTIDELCQKAAAIARGLVFLHSQLQLPDSTTKPAMAHRDLKSRNVLVKNDGECCISDFGLAVKFAINENVTTGQGKVGTPRYMAPEVIEGAISFQLESFLRIDVYAFALIVWEMITRCVIPGYEREVKAHRLPYVDELGENPTDDQLTHAVVTNRVRPKFPSFCSVHPTMETLKRTVEECWDMDPEARLTAQCALDRIIDIAPVTAGLSSENTEKLAVDMPFLPMVDNGKSATSGGTSGGLGGVYSRISMGNQADGGMANMRRGDPPSWSGPPAYSSSTYPESSGASGASSRYQSSAIVPPPTCTVQPNGDITVNRPMVNGHAGGTASSSYSVGSLSGAGAERQMLAHNPRHCPPNGSTSFELSPPISESSL